MSDSTCKCESNVSYCMAPYLATQVPEPEPTGDPLAPMRDGMFKDCADYYTVAFTDTCQTILDANSITMAELFAW